MYLGKHESVVQNYDLGFVEVISWSIVSHSARRIFSCEFHCQ